MGTATATGFAGQAPSVFMGGKNFGVTAGLDVGFYSIGNFRIAAEARGTFPASSGKGVGERSILGGGRVSYENNSPLRPYVDAFFGRGQLNYQLGGYVIGNYLYTQTATNIYAAGGGVEWDVTQHFSAKLDVQGQHWNSPVVTGGSMWSKQASIGVAYRIGAGSGPR